jgi:hypothetical protein
VKSLTVSTTITTPMTLKQFEEYLPNAFDESLSLLQKVNKIIKVLNDVTSLLSDGVDQAVLDQLNAWLADGTLASVIGGGISDLDGRLDKQESMWTQVNGSPSAKAGESVYIPNDANVFGYMATGTSKANGDTWVNLVTAEQNNIILVGDSGSEQPLWLEAGTYHSLRAPLSPSFQKLDSNGNPIEDGRTILHQGIASNHFIGFASGSQSLPINVYTTLNNITTVNSQFPPSSWDNTGYLIPRTGVYEFNPKIKISQAVAGAGSIRFALYIVHSDNSTTLSDIEDVDYNGTYGTPFKGVSFQYKMSAGDRAYIQVRPLTETLTIAEGSQIHIYGLGDTITS